MACDLARIQRGHLSRSVLEVAQRDQSQSPAIDPFIAPTVGSLFQARLSQTLATESDPKLRVCAIKVLGHIGNEQAVQILAPYVKDLGLDEQLSMAVIEALDTIASSSDQFSIPLPSTMLSPTQVDVLLITVTRVETQAVLKTAKEVSKAEAIKEFRGNSTYYNLGTIGGASTWLVFSEMGSGGPGGSTVTILDAIGEFSPKALIMVGIAFGVDPKNQTIGRILVSRQIIDYEFQKVDDTGQIVPRGDRVQASQRLINRFRTAYYEQEDMEVEFGLVLSGAKLIDNIDFRDRLRQLEPEAIGGEMEGAGLYAAAASKKVDWILVKAICDYADGHKRENKEESQKIVL